MPSGRQFFRGSVDTQADQIDMEDSIDPYTNLPKGKNFTAGAVVCQTPGSWEDNESQPIVSNFRPALGAKKTSTQLEIANLPDG